MSRPRTDEMFEAKFDAQFLDKQRQLIVFEEMGSSPTFSSPSLTTYSGSETYGARRYQTHDITSGSTDRPVILAGNNFGLEGDLGRRFVNVQIDGRDWTRLKPYAGGLHLNKWVKANRWEFLSAVMTIVRFWSQSGQPRLGMPESLISANTWHRTVGGLLAPLGVDYRPDVILASSARIDESLELVESWGHMVIGLLNGTGPNHLAADLVSWINSLELEPDGRKKRTREEREHDINVLQDVLSTQKSAESDPKRLGKWLGSVEGRIVQGSTVKIVRGPKLGGRQKWRVERVGPIV